MYIVMCKLKYKYKVEKQNKYSYSDPNSDLNFQIQKPPQIELFFNPLKHGGGVRYAPTSPFFAFYSTYIEKTHTWKFLSLLRMPLYIKKSKFSFTPS